MAGRPSLKVTPKMRRDVESMKADGFSDDRVAAQLGISRSTLLKHFAHELEFGADKVRREAMTSLRRMMRKSVAAANSILKRTDVSPPPGTAVGPKPPNLGKKEERDAEANAPPPDEWGALVRH